MYYFLKTSKFNLEEYDFSIEVFPRITKKEQDLLNVFLEKNQEDKPYSEFDKKDIYNFESEDLNELLKNLLKKEITCKFFDGEKVISEITFNIFSFVAIENNKVIYAISEPVKKSLKKYNIFNRIGLLPWFQLRFPTTKAIYHILLRENKHKGVVEFSLEEFKEKLGIDPNKYNRFYDLEAKILKPILKDIETTDNFIWFEKIKVSESKSAKVIGIKLHYSNLYHIGIHKKTNELLRIYSDYIIDFTVAYKKIYEEIGLNGPDETESYLELNFKSFFIN